MASVITWGNDMFVMIAIFSLFVVAGLLTAVVFAAYECKRYENRIKGMK